ncbi:hypothetical protein Tco_0956196 [Tanacetum coccineum]|uniref:Uncharacterized protein n=1 Tax=Tanacetum coccineum TaxID=301880 RepID=A0ABQ5E9E6_9ASTR
MENANPVVPAPPYVIRARITQELNELRAISAMIDSRLEDISHTHILISPPVPLEQLLDDFMNPPNVFEMNDSESDSESNDMPLVSPFLDFDEESDDGEVINELNKYGTQGISTAYNTIMVEGLKSTGRNLVAIVRDVYAFLRSFTYVTDFVVLKDIGEFIVSDMADVVMGRPFRVVIFDEESPKVLRIFMWTILG